MSVSRLILIVYFASALGLVARPGAVSSGRAGLPAQEDVFSIASFSPAETNYVSSDTIFSALPFYQPVSDSDSISDYPSHKAADTQQGAIVLRDKTVLFFSTRSAKYLSVVDGSNHSTLYRLTKPPPQRRAAPKPPPKIGGLPFPKAEDVFCVAMFPWNRGKHFTAQTLTDALPRFRALSEKDIPAKAIEAASNTEKFAFPREWSQAQHDPHVEPLNGILVLTNGAILKWITWTPTAITFQNYRRNTYFVIDQ
jgi:hypothetical protein